MPVLSIRLTLVFFFVNYCNQGAKVTKKFKSKTKIEIV